MSCCIRFESPPLLRNHTMQPLPCWGTFTLLKYYSSWGLTIPSTIAPAPEGLYRSATMWRTTTSELLGGRDWLQVGRLRNLERLAFSEPTPLSTDPLLCLLIFCFIDIHFQLLLVNLMPPNCFLQRHRLSWSVSATRWLQGAGQLCAKHPQCHKRPTLEPLDVIRWPPWPSPYLLSPLGDWLHEAEKYL